MGFPANKQLLRVCICLKIIIQNLFIDQNVQWTVKLNYIYLVHMLEFLFFLSLNQQNIKFKFFKYLELHV